MKDPSIQLWCEDEVHFQRHSSLIRMWAPKGQQPRVLSPSVRYKVGFFGAAQLEHWMPTDQGNSNFQCRDLWRFYPLSPRIYSRESIPYLGQCQMAQGENFERLLRVQSKPSGTNLPAAIFTRTQSSGTGLANYSSAGNSQPLFPVGRRPQNRFSISIYEMEAG